MAFIRSVALVAFAASPAAAFWRLPCASPVVVERADPIVNPGNISGHVHTIMGGNAFDFTMDYDTTQQSTCTSCRVHGDLSNYWIPTLYFKHQNGTFQRVDQNGGMLVYYLQRTGTDGEKLKAFPEGFRMLAGDPYKRSGGDDFPTQAISYACLDYSGNTHHPETNNFPNYNCPNGLRSQVFFPACWDGHNLDSKDHKSHVAYPINAYNTGKCPDTHPVHLISIFYEIIWETDKFADMWYGDSQPFVWSMGDTTGYGLHGDFINGWDVDLLQRAVDTCTADSGVIEDCHEFTLYTNQEAGQCNKTSRLSEPMDFVDALPGCNPLTDGPDRASPVSPCNRLPEIVDGDGEVPGLSNGGSSGSSGSESATSSPEAPTTTAASIPSVTLATSVLPTYSKADSSESTTTKESEAAPSPSTIDPQLISKVCKAHAMTTVVTMTVTETVAPTAAKRAVDIEVFDELAARDISVPARGRHARHIAMHNMKQH